MKLRPLFQDIAAAIREKDGTAGPIVAFDFPARIRAIQTIGGEIVLQSLRITDPPAKLEYICNGFGGEEFDPDGMTLEANLTAFDNSIVIPIDLSYVSFEPSGPLTEEVQAVTVLFRFGTQTVAADQPITVRFQPPSWADLENSNLIWRELENRFESWDALENYGRGDAS